MEFHAELAEANAAASGLEAEPLSDTPEGT